MNTHTQLAFEGLTSMNKSRINRKIMIIYHGVVNHSDVWISGWPPSKWCLVNSLVPGRSGCNLKQVIFKLISRIDTLSISCEIDTGPRWWLFNIDQVMAWCHQATSHHLSQCCPRSMSVIIGWGNCLLPLPSPMLAFYQLHFYEQISVKF